MLDRGSIVWEGEPSKLHHQEPLLSGLGMELPPLLKLKSLMISSGYDVSDTAMNAEEMADEVIKVINRSV